MCCCGVVPTHALGIVAVVYSNLLAVRRPTAQMTYNGVCAKGFKVDLRRSPLPSPRAGKIERPIPLYGNTRL